MKDDIDVVRTPKGACLGIRVMINGRTGLRYKAGKKVDELFPEQIVECISGMPVDYIVYKNESTSKDKDDQNPLVRQV